MDLYNEVMTHDKIYSLLHSPDKVSHMTLEEQIIDVNISELRWSDNKLTFFHLWHWAKPNDLYEYANIYTRETYGKGWAFTKEEIYEAWNKENH